MAGMAVIGAPNSYNGDFVAITGRGSIENDSGSFVIAGGGDMGEIFSGTGGGIISDGHSNGKKTVAADLSHYISNFEFDM